MRQGAGEGRLWRIRVAEDAISGLARSVRGALGSAEATGATRVVDPCIPRKRRGGDQQSPGEGRGAGSPAWEQGSEPSIEHDGSPLLRLTSSLPTSGSPGGAQV